MAGEFDSRLLKIANRIKVAQESNIVNPAAAGGEAVMPTMPMGEAAPAGEGDIAGAPGDMGMGEATPLDAPAEEEGGKEIDKPTSWIVKFHKDNFWIGKVFPGSYMEEAVSFFSQRKSVPKEQVREYFEELKSGDIEEMPQELADAPETELEGGGEMGGPAPSEGAPAGAAGGIPAAEQQFAAPINM